MILLLLATALIGLFLTVIGLPGTWLFLGAATLFKLFDETIPLAWWAIFTGFGLALVAEAIEWLAASRYAMKYGGSGRAGWGALIGGIAGAFAGIPIPIIGSLIGSLAGSFIGALIAEYSVGGSHEHAGRVAWGALIGRVVATAAKASLGAVVAVLVLLSALG